LPLLPPKLVDPFWQLAFCSALCSNGFLALLAVLLVNLSRRAETLAWRQEQELLQEDLLEQELEELQTQQDTLGPADPEPGQHAARGRSWGRPRRGAVDAAYFETLAAEDDTTPG